MNYKLWHLVDYDAANRFLLNVDWHNIIHFNPSPDSMWSAFVHVIQHVIKFFVPVKEINLRSSRVLKRYSNSVRNAMAKRRLWKLRKTQPDNFLIRLKYRESIRSCKSLINTMKKNKLKQNIVYANNVGTFYKHVNRRINCRSGVSALKGSGDELISDDSSKAELLNIFFFFFCLCECP